MAQRIQVICDPCQLDDNKDTAASTYRFGIELPGQRWQWFAIDLCERHAANTELDGLPIWAAKYGRGESAPKAAKAAKAAKAQSVALGPSARAAVVEGREVVCPQCGKVCASEQGLKAHQTRSHADKP